MLFTLTVFLLFSMLLSSSLSAQTSQYYATENDLSSNLINCIYQDKKGFVWIATEYGLNRFDGMKFKLYKHINNDSTSLKDNYVRTIFETSDGRLLVGTIKGLIQYCWESNAFKSVTLIQDKEHIEAHVTGIIELNNGDCWITTSGKGLFTLKLREYAAYYDAETSLKLSSNYLNSIYKDSNGSIWIGSENNGLNCYNLRSKEIKIFRPPVISSDNISSIVEDRNGNLFVGTLTKGLNRYDREKECFIPVKGEDKTTQLIYTLLVNSDNQLLIGTDGQGLKVYNEEKDEMENFEVNAVSFDFNKSKIHAILEDHNGGIWLGMFQKGVVYVPKIRNKFDYYGYKSAKHNIIGSCCVMSLCKDRNNILWVATDNDGIYGVDESDNSAVHFKQTASPLSVPDIILSVFEDSRRNLWIGSYFKGLAKMDSKTGKCQYINELVNEKVYYITEDKQGGLLIGTFGSGLFIMDTYSGELTHYESSKREEGDFSVDELSNDWINYILCDSDGLIWIGHYKGLSCFDPIKKTFINYNNTNNLLPGHIVSALCEDSKGGIWIGTTMSLYRFDKKNGTFEEFPTQNSPAGNMISGIIEDNDGYLWISTYRGIYKLNPATRSFSHYYAGDGLQGNEFTRGALFKDKHGKLYFGGTNGVTNFYPRDITDNKQANQIHLTGFYIFNQPVNQGDRSGRHEIVSSSVFDAELFQLSHKDNTFTIEFSTLDFVNPEQIIYAYKMEGLNADWTSTQPGVNQITYNNLPPGDYVFSVKLYDDPDSEKKIRIHIDRPWYQSWWAMLIYLLAALILIAGIISFIYSKIYYRQELLKKEHVQAINEAKLQFFINISHEIRTPMTLIINPLEKLIASKTDSSNHQAYLIMYRNAQRILRLINQLMDIRKIDKGLMKINCRETDMVGFIEDLMRTFDYSARQKNIDFVFEHDMERLQVWVDLNNFDKVMLNVLSNAFKFTPNNGKIIVRLSTGKDDKRLSVNNYFEIKVIDNGIGVDVNNIERIFDRFYQIDNIAQKDVQGTGVGLHLSRQLVELHHGIIYAEKRDDHAQGIQFVIRLPMGYTHLLEEELETSEAAVQRVAMYYDSDRTGLAYEVTESEELPTLVKSKTKYKVLVVEDEDELRHFIQSELSPFYKVKACSDGKEALDLVLKNNFDAIVSDIMMPVMDGITLTRKIKQNININHTPVILLSARTQIEDHIEGLGIGADAYLDKPFRTDILVQTINNLIANREILRTKFCGHQEYDDKITPVQLKSSDELLMNRVLKIINEQLANPKLNVELLASNVGLSRVHLHRKLKELTNQNARNFIRGIRLKQAALLLSEKKFTVSDVAYATGFNSIPHFSASFKEFYGMSPTEYVEKINQ
ncbi:MAG: response regulator [Bacteroidales bacterium]|nr:response regulator [Bacteroidales bacterium]MCL2133728.1 response regulator [Bacteroidales bacterium]